MAAARGEWARSYVLDQITLADMTERLAQATGDPAAWLAATPERLRAVDAAALQRALAPCVGHTVVTAAGPELVAAELGAAERYDWRAVREQRWVALDPDAPR